MAVAEVVDTDIDALSEAEVRQVLRLAQSAIDRLAGFRTRAAGALESRALTAAPTGRENQALRAVRERTGSELRLTPTQTKQAGETGRRLAESPAAIAALTAGVLPADHARLLADTLRWLSGHVRADAEATLLAAAVHQDAREFGRTCRRLLAQTDTDAAMDALERQHTRRSLKIVQTQDGLTALHGQGTGLDAEYLHTAVHAFRRPDAAGEVRSSEQRSWDALIDVCRAALDAGTAPANRHVRPHVLITVAEPTVADRDDAGDGAVEAAWTGPLPWPEARRLLTDAGVSRVLTDPAGLPTRAGESVRTVPAGLWKALQVRHATCAGDGCTVPAAWCQVMHLDVPYRLRGRLDLDTAAPGCHVHHRMLDRHGWTVTWTAGRPIIHHPDRPPRAGPDPGDHVAARADPDDAQGPGDARAGPAP